MPIKKGTTISKNNLIEKIDDISVNDGSTYYILDLQLLDNLSLNYGQGASSEDRFLINADSHVIYYEKGVNYEGEKYHTVR